MLLNKYKIVAAYIFLLSFPCFAQQAIELPKEVQAFVEKKQACDHFLGEYPESVNKSNLRLSLLFLNSMQKV